MKSSTNLSTVNLQESVIDSRKQPHFKKLIHLKTHYGQTVIG